MFEKEEEKLADYKNLFDHLETPDKALDDAILAGFQKAKAEEKRKYRRRKWIISLLAAAVVLVGFFTTIRLSPAFADYIKVIPGMEKIVDLIRDDKGKMLAIENDYYEKIGVSQEKNGMKFTIEGAIADEKNLVLFYKLESKEKVNTFRVEDPKLFGKDGEKINWGTASDDGRGVQTSKDGKSTFNGSLELSFESPLQTKTLELKAKVRGAEQTESFAIPFELKKEIKETKTYQINKAVTIEGQKITFIDATIYPIRIAVHVKMDQNNTKKLLNFDDICLVDENGETWNKIANGITASKISDDESIIYLQSNYFREPKELYLVLNKIQALDKDQAMVVIDTKNQKILKQPNENLFSSLYVGKDQINLKMRIIGKDYFDPIGTIKDGNGKEVNQLRKESSSNIDVKSLDIGIHIQDLQNIANPLSLEIAFFPAWINGQEKIRIK
ncbi:DUF4179 domain-containing protein [Neobacillus massiliamazoniensis]|uniref:DUF4179 domain-containing protein n=1 Tax=Neobacillus massiliamazoniensis TaxID=1499688 RepID=A0A0U1NVJ3_9BACI|nr:DUF4179 domain-containing protein [Neobacillus massiliamazoniensis]CRK82047.1 hypothetical protein BN000_01968 [Neobacillus massiliamazoniensis]